MKVTIGVPTYNRKELLEIMAKSLYDSDLAGVCNIRIYDDCSTAYDKDYLRKLFPTAVSIKVNLSNIKADKNIYQMYKDFLESGDDYFFNADSDIIFNSEWLNKGIEMINRTEGILSLFNANSHKSYSMIGNEFCLKESIGSAGTLFTRDRMFELFQHFNSLDDIGNFDWQWSSYLREQGVKIFCVQNSLIQHIGFEGQNSNLYFDVGEKFKIESTVQGQIINDIYVKSISAIMMKEKERVAKEEQLRALRVNDLGYHIKRCFVILVKKGIPKKVYSRIKRIYLLSVKI